MKFSKRLAIDSSSPNRVANLMTLVLIAFLLVFAFFIYPSLPEIIPTHFKGSGEADGFSSKSMYLVFVGFTILMAIGLYYLSFFPRIINYPTTITPENRDIQQEMAVTMLRQLNAFITACMTYIIVCIAYISKDVFSSSVLGWIFIFVMLGGMTWLIARYMIQARAKK